MRWWGIFVSFSVSIISCNETSPLTPTSENHPKLVFPYIIYPADNPTTPEKIALGEKLFFDTHLSKNNNVSCASCHKPEFRFADNVSVSIGTNGRLGFRNSPSIINVAYKPEFHTDGGVRTLELQVLAPIIDTNELGGDFTDILNYLNSDTQYLSMFESAFDTVPTVFGLTRAIATFERSLVSSKSKYDVFLTGDLTALSESQKKGLSLFKSERLNCIKCHSGVLFTDYSYQNVGLEEQFSDSGRARITYQHSDAGKFTTPSLRNVSLTAPYMHNGSIQTLDSVIIYFEKGGDSHWNKSDLIQPFNLTRTERQDLVHFLESLTDENTADKK